MNLYQYRLTDRKNMKKTLVCVIFFLFVVVFKFFHSFCLLFSKVFILHLVQRAGATFFDYSLICLCVKIFPLRDI